MMMVENEEEIEMQMEKFSRLLAEKEEEIDKRKLINIEDRKLIEELKQALKRQPYTHDQEESIQLQ